MAVLVLALDAGTALTLLTLAATGAVSALFLAHLAALFWRAAASAARDEQGYARRRAAIDRRRFLRSGLRATAGAIVLVSAARFPRLGRAQEPRECHCEIPEGADAFDLGDGPVNNQWIVCVNTADLVFNPDGKVGCFGPCAGEDPPPCVQQVSCTWDKKKTKATKGRGQVKFPGKRDSECCLTLVAGECPVTFHLEAEVAVKCLCGSTPLGGAAGECKKVLSTDITLECCCPTQIRQSIRRTDVTTQSGIRIAVWEAERVDNVKCLKNCDGAECERKALACEWSVAPKEGADPNLKIVGPNNNCTRVVVESTQGKKYEVCRKVTFKCACGSASTACEYKECKQG